MKLYSDTLTTQDLDECAPHGCYVIADPVHTKLRKNAWDFRLINHVPRRNGWAATYDEHGEWMNALYNRDPDMIVGPYRNREDFHHKTKHAYQRVTA